MARATRGKQQIELLVFGVAKLRLAGADLELPTKKLLAIMAYLALEGSATRAELAALLWNVADTRARANLRGELYRLRDSSLAWLLEEEAGRLRLAAAVQSDLEQFKVLCGRSQWQQALGLRRGALLKGFEIADAPAFEEWLLLTRESWQERFNEVLALEAASLVAAKNWVAAGAAYEQLLQADPWREEAVRGLMRTFAQTDEIPKALECFERFRVAVRGALGVQPANETVALAARLRSPRMASVPANLVSSLFVGRETEWAQLEAAWETQKFIFIYGQAGVGKTRLALEFAASKGALTLIECGQIDSIAPFALFTRRIREALNRVPLDRLPDWMRLELARLVPEFAPDTPSQQDIPLEGKMRLFEATTQFLLQAIQGTSGLILDNAQYFDTSSFELGGYLSTRAKQGAAPICSILTFRSNEVPPEIEARVQEYVQNNQAIIIQLQPLGLDSLERLLEANPKQDLDANRLGQMTGGNPLFVLEVLRAWKADGTIPTTPAIDELLRSRLAKLSTTARDVARVAAISGANFTLLIAARVLNTDALQLIESYEQLEQHGIVRAARFSHDLLLEAVLNAMPLATRVLLQTRLLEVLTTMPLERGQAAERLRLAQAVASNPKIVFWAEQAAIEALELFATSKAITYFETALQALSYLRANTDLKTRLEGGLEQAKTQI